MERFLYQLRVKKSMRGGYYLFILFLLGIIVSGCSGTETTIESEPVAKNLKLELVDYPSEVTDDKPFVVKWKVEGEGKITHTAVHYDFESHGADFKAYKDVSAVYTGIGPKEFSGNVNAEKIGFVFIRAHAIVDDEHVYSEEMKVEVIPYKEFEEDEVKVCPECLEPTDWSTCAGGQQNRQIYVCNGDTNFLCQDRLEDRACEEVVEEVVPVTLEFSIDVSDIAFTPNKLRLAAGEMVKITFNSIRPGSFGGADVRDKDGLIKTGKMSIGESKTVEFVMPGNDVLLTNYWPASTTKKSEMTIAVG